MSYFYIYFAILCIAYCLILMESAPHNDVQDLNDDLRRFGFKQLTTEDDFKKSVTCSSCGVQDIHGSKQPTVISLLWSFRLM